MTHLLWIAPLVAGLAAIWWDKLMGFALLVGLICAVVALTGLVLRAPAALPPRHTGQERDTRDVERDIPPPSG